MATAALLATPELDLAEDEAKRYAASLARISNLYDDRFNPKIVAWVDLLAVMGTIYGPRIIAIKARWNAEDQAAKRASGITPINNPPRKTNSQSAPAQSPARSPMELFGDVNYGANIPDAM